MRTACVSPGASTGLKAAPGARVGVCTRPPSPLPLSDGTGPCGLSACAAPLLGLAGASAAGSGADTGATGGLSASGARGIVAVASVEQQLPILVALRL